MLKESNCQPGIQYPAKICFRNEEEIKTLSEEGKLRELVIRRPILKEWLKEFLKQKRNCKRRRPGTSGKQKEHDKQKYG